MNKNGNGNYPRQENKINSGSNNVIIEMDAENNDDESYYLS